MGSNVIFLSEHTVPSYRRPRLHVVRTEGSAGTSAWAQAARRRAAQHSLPEGSCPPAGDAAAVRLSRRLDPGQAPDAAGRLRISGRLADVCAALDRLAANEVNRRPAA